MKRNAFFQLVQKQDGVYLKSYPALEGGAPLSVDDIYIIWSRKRSWTFRWMTSPLLCRKRQKR